MKLLLLYIFAHLLIMVPVVAKIVFPDWIDNFGRRFYKDPRKADLFTGSIIFSSALLGFLIIAVCYFAT